jgi:hypothetical protein
MLASTIGSGRSKAKLAIAPALLFPSPLRILVLLVVPLVWTCARVDSGRALPGTPLNVALWCLLIMVAISLYATFDIRFSLGKVAGVVLGVVFFWAVARWVTTADRLKTAMAAYVIAGVGLAVIDNIDINGQLITKGKNQKDDDDDNDQGKGNNKDKDKDK